jgi:hypothetical protein
MVLARQGKHEAAHSEFQAGRKIIEKLKSAAPDNAVLFKDSIWFTEEIAKLSR